MFNNVHVTIFSAENRIREPFVLTWGETWNILDEIDRVSTLGFIRDGSGVVWRTEIAVGSGSHSIDLFLTRHKDDNELVVNLKKLYDKGIPAINETMASWFKTGVIHGKVGEEYKDWYMSMILGGRDE